MRAFLKFLKDPDLWGLISIFAFLYFAWTIASVVDLF